MATTGIAFLLKPLRETELAVAIHKRARLERHFVGSLVSRLAHRPQRLVGRRGRDWVGLDVADLAWIRVKNGITTAVTRDGAEAMLEATLHALADQLEPLGFLRVNRWYLVGLHAVGRVRPEGRGWLSLVLVPAADEPVVVTQEQSAAFRAWFA